MVQIFVIEDQPAIRTAYQLLIQREPDLQVCGEATTGNDALSALSQAIPDIILLDIALPDINGLDLLKIIKRCYPNLPVIIVSGRDELVYASRAFELGASGYIDKGIVARVLGMVIRRVMDGTYYFSGRILKSAASKGVSNPPNDA